MLTNQPLQPSSLAERDILKTIELIDYGINFLDRLISPLNEFNREQSIEPSPKRVIKKENELDTNLKLIRKYQKLLYDTFCHCLVHQSNQITSISREEIENNLKQITPYFDFSNTQELRYQLTQFKNTLKSLLDPGTKQPDQLPANDIINRYVFLCQFFRILLEKEIAMINQALLIETQIKPDSSVDLKLAFSQQRLELNEADLVQELSELKRELNQSSRNKSPIMLDSSFEVGAEQYIKLLEKCRRTRQALEKKLEFKLGDEDRSLSQELFTLYEEVASEVQGFNQMIEFLHHSEADFERQDYNGIFNINTKTTTTELQQLLQVGGVKYELFIKIDQEDFIKAWKDIVTGKLSFPDNRRELFSTIQKLKKSLADDLQFFVNKVRVQYKNSFLVLSSNLQQKLNDEERAYLNTLITSQEAILNRHPKTLQEVKEWFSTIKRVNQELLTINVVFSKVISSTRNVAILEAGVSAQSIQEAKAEIKRSTESLMYDLSTNERKKISEKINNHLTTSKADPTKPTNPLFLRASRKILRKLDTLAPKTVSYEEDKKEFSQAEADNTKGKGREKVKNPEAYDRLFGNNDDDFFSQPIESTKESTKARSEELKANSFESTESQSEKSKGKSKLKETTETRAEESKGKSKRKPKKNTEKNKLSSSQVTTTKATEEEKNQGFQSDSSQSSEEGSDTPDQTQLTTPVFTPTPVTHLSAQPQEQTDPIPEPKIALPPQTGAIKSKDDSGSTSDLSAPSSLSDIFDEQQGQEVTYTQSPDDSDKAQIKTNPTNTAKSNSSAFFSSSNSESENLPETDHSSYASEETLPSKQNVSQVNQSFSAQLDLPEIGGKSSAPPPPPPRVSSRKNKMDGPPPPPPPPLSIKEESPPIPPALFEIQIEKEKERDRLSSSFSSSSFSSSSSRSSTSSEESRNTSSSSSRSSSTSSSEEKPISRSKTKRVSEPKKRSSRKSESVIKQTKASDNLQTPPAEPTTTGDNPSPVSEAPAIRPVSEAPAIPSVPAFNKPEYNRANAVKIFSALTDYVIPYEKQPTMLRSPFVSSCCDLYEKLAPKETWIPLSICRWLELDEYLPLVERKDETIKNLFDQATNLMEKIYKEKMESQHKNSGKTMRGVGQTTKTSNSSDLQKTKQNATVRAPIPPASMSRTTTVSRAATPASRPRPVASVTSNWAPGQSIWTNNQLSPSKATNSQELSVNKAVQTLESYVTMLEEKIRGEKYDDLKVNLNIKKNEVQRIRNALLLKFKGQNIKNNTHEIMIDPMQFGQTTLDKSKDPIVRVVSQKELSSPGLLLHRSGNDQYQSIQNYLDETFVYLSSSPKPRNNI